MVVSTSEVVADNMFDVAVVVVDALDVVDADNVVDVDAVVVR